MPSIGLVANVYNEVHALPGWLETHLPYFDDVRIVHAGPGGEHSNDGTIELLKHWNIPILFTCIDDGFGIVRTKAIHWSPCDYVMILDADERFFRMQPVLVCGGESNPQSEVDWILQGYDFHGVNLPNWENVGKLGHKLVVSRDNDRVHDQGKMLRNLLNDKPDAVASIRRHWHDFSMTKPTQDWNVHPDWQMRIVRNNSSIRYNAGTKMHERLVGANKVFQSSMYGPYFDHFHFTFKRMEQEQRRHDIAIYDSLHEGRKPPILEEFTNR